MDLKNLAPYLGNATGSFSFIPAPRDASSVRDLDLEGLGRLLKALPQIFNLTVIDCGTGLDPWAVKVFEASTAIFLVTVADVIAINQTKRLISKIQELLFPPEMVQILLNKYSANSSDWVFGLASPSLEAIVQASWA